MHSDWNWIFSKERKNQKNSNNNWIKNNLWKIRKKKRTLSFHEDLFIFFSWRNSQMKMVWAINKFCMVTMDICKKNSDFHHFYL